MSRVLLTEPCYKSLGWTFLPRITWFHIDMSITFKIFLLETIKVTAHIFGIWHPLVDLHHVCSDYNATVSFCPSLCDGLAILLDMTRNFFLLAWNLELSKSLNIWYVALSSKALLDFSNYDPTYYQLTLYYWPSVLLFGPLAILFGYQLILTQ